MGWGRMFLLGNIGQQMDIQEQREEMRRLRRTVREVQRTKAGQEDLAAHVVRLEDEVDELRLYLTAVIRHLVGKGLASEAELEALIEAVDAEDGTVDGGLAPREGSTPAS